MKQEYWVTVGCAWVESVKADSIDEAIKKMEDKYKYGKAPFPREFVEVSEEMMGFQIED